MMMIIYGLLLGEEMVAFYIGLNQCFVGGVETLITLRV